MSRLAAFGRNLANRSSVVVPVTSLRGSQYVYGLSVDNFPSEVRYVGVRFHRAQFAAADWRVTELPGYVVIAAR